MKSVTLSELCGDIYNLFEEVLTTGIPLEISMGGRMLRIVPVEKGDKLKNLAPRSDIIVGDPNDLVDVRWGYDLDSP